jgi:hypothetical protein
MKHSHKHTRTHPFPLLYFCNDPRLRLPCISPSSPFPGIEDLREKREEVNRQILKEEEEKAKIQKVRKQE